MSPLSLISLRNKVAFITGSTRGIGKEIAKTLALAGAEVIIHGRNKKDVDNVVREFEKYGLLISGETGDLLSLGNIKKIFKNVKTKHRHLDILVNNAAVNVGNARFIESKEIEKLIGVNLAGAIHCASFAIPFMSRGGKIINIGSCEAFCGCFANSVYAASKAGLLGFTMALSKKLADLNITVNMVSPGPTNTERARKMFSKDQSPDGKSENSSFFTDIQDITNIILFLTSSFANSITGQNFVISTKNKKHFYG